MWKGRKLDDMSREELIDAFNELWERYMKALADTEELRGETITEMQRLLHNARTNYTRSIAFLSRPHSEPLAFVNVPTQHLEDELRDITKVLQEGGWDH